MSLPRGLVLLALVTRHFRLWWRSRRMIVAAVLVAATWLARPDAASAVATLWAGFFAAMLTAAILGGGIIAQDFESGAMTLHRLHGATPLELTLGALVAVASATLLALAAWAGAAVAALPSFAASSLATPLLACVLGLVAWSSMVVSLGATLPGFGNVAGVTALALLGSADDLGEVPVLSAVLIFVRDILPLPRHAMNIVRQSNVGLTFSTEVLTLALGSLMLTGLTVFVLTRREPASGWRR